MADVTVYIQKGNRNYQFDNIIMCSYIHNSDRITLLQLYENFMTSEPQYSQVWYVVCHGLHLLCS